MRGYIPIWLVNLAVLAALSIAAWELYAPGLIFLALPCLLASCWWWQRMGLDQLALRELPLGLFYLTMGYRRAYVWDHTLLGAWPAHTPVMVYRDGTLWTVAGASKSGRRYSLRSPRYPDGSWYREVRAADCRPVRIGWVYGERLRAVEACRRAA